jgi:choline dehydrogenase-like flavoprotein
MVTTHEVDHDRLTQTGHTVVVLERGKEYPPAGYPRSPACWDPSSHMPDSRWITR